jgi:hypothetical protein
MIDQMPENQNPVAKENDFYNAQKNFAKLI